MEKSPAHGRDWLEAGLLFLLLQVAAARLVTTGWATYLYVAESLAALGTFLGLALGASRFPRRIVIWFVIDYTLVLVPWQLTSGMDSDLLFWDQITGSWGRILYSMGQFAQRQPVTDSFFFVAFVSIGFWLISLAAGYWLMRHNNVLVAILPAGLVTLLVQIYDNYYPRRSWWLAVYLLIALLLVGREYYLRSRMRWTKQRVVVNEEAWTDIFGGLLTTVIFSVIVAWTIPTSLPSLQTVSDTWNNMTQPILDRFSNAVSSLKSSGGAPGAGSYGDSLALGLNAASGDSVLFSVRVVNPPETSSRYYWRGRVYNLYDHGQWTNTSALHTNFEPADGDIHIANSQGRTSTTFDFQSQASDLRLFYTPSQPVWLDKPGVIQSTRVDPVNQDILSWAADPPIRKGSTYQVKAAIANPDLEALTAAGTDYPQWVTDRYLEVPEDIKSEIQSLAQKLTAGQSNPYDKANAITSYLRSTIQYSTSVAQPPQGMDPILWVLLDYKQGFCNYYASAEVLMLRSIGIPARLAVGYAQGQYDGGTQTYIVRNRDAHAWPEVYFPNIGWVEFEPTANQDALVRPRASQAIPVNPDSLSRRPERSGEAPAPADSGQQDHGSLPSTPFLQTIPGRAILFGLSALSIFLLWFILNRYRLFQRLPLYLSKVIEQSGVRTPAWITDWAYWNQSSPVEKAFTSINLSLWWLGQPQPVHATPAERAQALTHLLPSASSLVATLTRELETALYSRQPADLSRARRAGILILLHTLRLRLQRTWESINGTYHETR